MQDRSDNRMVTFQGRTLCVMDWAKHVGLSYSGMCRRLKTWSIKDALTTPRRLPNATRPRRGHSPPLTD